MKKYIITLLLSFVAMVLLLSTAHNLVGRKYEPKTVKDTTLTIPQFNEFCKKEKISNNLNKWLVLSVDDCNNPIQWLYPKGENADTLILATKKNIDTIYIDVRCK